MQLSWTEPASPYLQIKATIKNLTAATTIIDNVNVWPGTSSVAFADQPVGDTLEATLTVYGNNVDTEGNTVVVSQHIVPAPPLPEPDPPTNLVWS